MGQLGPLTWFNPPKYKHVAYVTFFMPKNGTFGWGVTLEQYATLMPDVLLQTLILFFKGNPKSPRGSYLLLILMGQ